MLDGATDWIHGHVQNIESIEVVQQWALSTVMRVHTLGGDVYFKASIPLPLSADEPRLAMLFARLYPADVPDLIAVDLERRWMLIGDAGANLHQQPRYDLWHRALLRLAQIQQDSQAYLDSFEQAGCRDGRPARLDAMIDALLANEAMLSGLEADEAQRLRRLPPKLHENCRALKQVTLVHGDFYGANIGCKAGRLRFFDWSESCLAHPFFDLPVILHDAAAYFSPEQVDALRDDYLACWEDGQRQWQIAAPVAALHHAMMYNGVAEAVNPDKPRLRVSRWLRDLLASA